MKCDFEKKKTYVRGNGCCHFAEDGVNAFFINIGDVVTAFSSCSIHTDRCGNRGKDAVAATKQCNARYDHKTPHQMCVIDAYNGSLNSLHTCTLHFSITDNVKVLKN